MKIDSMRGLNASLWTVAATSKSSTERSKFAAYLNQVATALRKLASKQTDQSERSQVLADLTDHSQKLLTYVSADDLDAAKVFDVSSLGESELRKEATELESLAKVLERGTVTERLTRAALTNAVQLARDLGPIEHTGVKGLFREALIHSVFEPLLPEPYRVGTGVIVDAVGQQSGQCDLIVYDPSILAPLYQAGGAGLYPVESVLAVAEIKSELDSASYRQTLGNLHGISKMRFLDPDKAWAESPRLPIGIVFGFASASVEKGEASRIQDAAAALSITRPESLLQLVCVFGKETQAYVDGDWKQLSGDVEHSEAILALCAVLNSLAAIADNRTKGGSLRRGEYLRQGSGGGVAG